MPEEYEAFLALRDFMYATVYVDKNAKKREEQKVDKLIAELYEYYLTHVDQMSNFMCSWPIRRDGNAPSPTISGMSDEFAIRTFEERCSCPKMARPLKLERSFKNNMIPHEYIEELTRRTRGTGTGGQLCAAQAQGTAVRRSVPLSQRKNAVLLCVP